MATEPSMCHSTSSLPPGLDLGWFCLMYEMNYLREKTLSSLVFENLAFYIFKKPQPIQSQW